MKYDKTKNITPEIPHQKTKNETINILVIDDCSITQKAMKLTLMALGYNYIKALDAFIAIDIITDNPPDLIILDLQMPHMNGFDVLDYYKHKNLNVPIIVSTAMNIAEVEQQCLDAGAAKVVNTIYIKEIVKVVQELVSDRIITTEI